MMEYKTSKLSPEEELDLIKSYIPTANNLPHNLNTLHLMGLEEVDIKEIFNGQFVLLYEGLINPFTGNKLFAGVTRIELQQKSEDSPAQIYINSRPAEEFFAEPIPQTNSARDIDSLIEENEALRKQILDFQERYDDIYAHCKNLQRKLNEDVEKL